MRALRENAVAFVPPLATGSVPVTSAARFTDEVLTEPLVALRKPLSVPRTKLLAYRLVVVALVVVP